MDIAAGDPVLEGIQAERNAQRIFQPINMQPRFLIGSSSAFEIDDVQTVYIPLNTAIEGLNVQPFQVSPHAPVPPLPDAETLEIRLKTRVNLNALLQSLILGMELSDNYIINVATQLNEVKEGRGYVTYTGDIVLVTDLLEREVPESVLKFVTELQPIIAGLPFVPFSQYDLINYQKVFSHGVFPDQPDASGIYVNSVPVQTDTILGRHTIIQADYDNWVMNTNIWAMLTDEYAPVSARTISRFCALIGILHHSKTMTTPKRMLTPGRLTAGVAPNDDVLQSFDEITYEQNYNLNISSTRFYVVFANILALYLLDEDVVVEEDEANEVEAEED